jgi:DNA-binding NarL/FixJ family response regulator
MKTPRQIWILEDHVKFAQKVQRLIECEDDLECPHHFTHPDELIGELSFNPQPPDLLLLDLGLPGRNGLLVLGEVRERVPDLKVVILTAFDDRQRVYQAICAGASGYLLKTADPDEIIAGIRDVLDGAAALSPPVASMILAGFAKLGPVNDIEPLTPREEEVLSQLVQGFIKKEIADHLDISLHTVDMHLRSVYRKLHVRTQTEAVSKAIRRGIV